MIPTYTPRYASIKDWIGQTFSEPSSRWIGAWKNSRYSSRLMNLSLFVKAVMPAPGDQKARKDHDRRLLKNRIVDNLHRDPVDLLNRL